MSSKLSREKPTYFMCGKKDIPELIAKAEAEAKEILEEFLMFFKPAKPLNIEIFTTEYDTCYSIGAKLIWNKDTVLLEESDCDLLFLHLNHIILNRIIQLRKEVSEC